MLTLPDGALYDAQWARGKRHGVCLYRPPTPRSLGAATVQYVGLGRWLVGCFKDTL